MGVADVSARGRALSANLTTKCHSSSFSRSRGSLTARIGGAGLLRIAQVSSSENRSPGRNSVHFDQTSFEEMASNLTARAAGTTVRSIVVNGQVVVGEHVSVNPSGGTLVMGAGGVPPAFWLLTSDPMVPKMADYLQDTGEQPRCPRFGVTRKERWHQWLPKPA